MQVHKPWLPWLLEFYTAKQYVAMYVHMPNLLYCLNPLVPELF